MENRFIVQLIVSVICVVYSAQYTMANTNNIDYEIGGGIILFFLPLGGGKHFCSHESDIVPNSFIIRTIFYGEKYFFKDFSIGLRYMEFIHQIIYDNDNSQSNNQTLSTYMTLPDVSFGYNMDLILLTGHWKFKSIQLSRDSLSYINFGLLGGQSLSAKYRLFHQDFVNDNKGSVISGENHDDRSSNGTAQLLETYIELNFENHGFKLSFYRLFTQFEKMKKGIVIKEGETEEEDTILENDTAPNLGGLGLYLTYNYKF